MHHALIRLEDIAPGGSYDSEESYAKMVAIADFLYASHVPFHAAVISRYVDPAQGVDRAMSDPADRTSAGFVRMLRALVQRGASLGIHGYTHQYGGSVSGEGFEFAYAVCSQDCPPDDRIERWTPPERLWRSSYAAGRFRMALSTFDAAGLRPQWFETPHYTASPAQRKILEIGSWLMYEDNPDMPESRSVTVRRSLNPFYGRTVYVPTPLGYVSGADVEQDVARIKKEAAAYRGDDLASFFYHPYLEFPYIRLRSGASPDYADKTPLKELVRHIQALGRRFVDIRTVIQSAALFEKTSAASREPPCC